MHIWIDGDACPWAIKDIIFRHSLNHQISTVLVANSFQKLPVPHPYLRLQVVSKAFDAADHYIIAQVVPGDLVITNDIPMAYEVVKKQVVALGTTGDVFSEQNIGERLAVRDLMATLRGGMLISGGPPPFDEKDKKRFADVFNRTITRLHAAPPPTRSPSA